MLSRFKVNNHSNVLKIIDCFPKIENDTVIFQVVIDFDGTLTLPNALICHEVLAEHNPQLRQKQIDLNNKMSCLLSQQNGFDQNWKTLVYNSWWNDSQQLLVDAGLNFSHVRYAAEQLSWRYDAKALLDHFERANIPVLVFSAGVSDVIISALEILLGHRAANIHVVANQMKFDKKGSLIGWSEPIIHSLNKKFSILNEEERLHLKQKKFSLIVGDSSYDANMLDGWNGSCLRIGLCDQANRVESYTEHFDIVSMEEDLTNVLDLVKHLTN